MCGIGGFFSPRWPDQDFATILQNMGDALRRRGPDDSGTWFDAENGIGLAHRRLAIIDLSQAGHQPMTSHNGRYVIVYNGEIYNHMDLRQELEAGGTRFSWTGHSDTETLLAGFETWGVDATLRRCIGMFAFALWCKRTKVLTLARDRMGEKPLYYGWQATGAKRTLLFGSELKALREHPAFEADVDRNALAAYLRHNYVPAPYSIYKNIKKLLPGHIAEISPGAAEVVTRPYFDVAKLVGDAVAGQFTLADDELVSELQKTLLHAVKRQMLSDVPLGAFLSGGIDSSTIVALMQAQADQPVKTFTIGFSEDGFDEAPFAKAVARHLGTDHTEIVVSGDKAREVIPSLPVMYDEPFADASQIPTFLVSELARRSVTVSLSGDGGDELFAGYSRYEMAQTLWDRISPFPLPLRNAGAWAIRKVPAMAWNGVLSPFISRPGSGANIGDKLHKGAGLLGSKDIGHLYETLISQWPNPAEVLVAGAEPVTWQEHSDLVPKSNIERMMIRDTRGYLPDDILAKVDRAAMYVSLETRVPLLDHTVVDFAWRTPLTQKIRNGKTKWALRQVLYRYVPQALIDRPKAGFSIPLQAWLRGPLKDWAETLLDQNRLASEGFFNAGTVREKWAEHLSGTRNWAHQLWCILMFQAWLKETPLKSIGP